MHLMSQVAALGLDPAKHLGKEVAFLQPYLHKLNEYVSAYLFCLFIFYASAYLLDHFISC